MVAFLPSTPQGIFLLAVISVLFLITLISSFRKNANITNILVISMVIVFSIQTILSFDAVYDLPVLEGLLEKGGDDLSAQLGFYPRAIVDDYAVYQFITYTYLHGGIIHMIMNLVGLFVLGTQFERKVGPKRFLMIYFGSGIISASVVLLISPYDILGQSMNTASIGASGCIFGILGGYWYLYPREEILFPLIYLKKWPLTLLVLIYGGISAVMLVWGGWDDVSHVGHFAGLVGAFPIAWLVRPPDETPIEQTKLSKERLQDMARSKGQKELLEKVLSADEKDVREAWLEEFFEKVDCPHCGKAGLSYSGGKAVCQNCGKKVRP